MKIALVCDWYAPRLGGIEVHLQELARRLTQAGHTVEVITTTPGPSAPGVVRLGVPLAPGAGVMYSPAAFRALDTAIARGHFDLVHAHISIVSPAAIGAGYIANRRAIPLVVTFHSWIPGMRALTRLIGGALGSRRWTALFTAVSTRVAREVAPCAPAGRVSILPNGIDTTAWGGQTPLIAPLNPPLQNQEGQTPLIPPGDTPPQNQEGLTLLIANKCFELVAVMRLNRKKRPFALVRLMSHLSHRLPDRTTVRLRIVGDGPERARLENAIVRRRLSHCVEFLGRQTHDEIRALYAGCDAFVLPTIRESFGIAAAEARAAGLPVIARAGSGVDDWITNEREGLLAPSDPALADAVLRLLTDDDLRARIRDHNRRTTSPIDWSPVLTRHLELYARAVALRRSVSA